MATNKNFIEFITDQIDDREWLCELIRITARELPEPKPKKKKGKKV